MMNSIENKTISENKGKQETIVQSEYADSNKKNKESTENDADGNFFLLF